MKIYKTMDAFKDAMQDKNYEILSSTLDFPDAEDYRSREMAFKKALLTIILQEEYDKISTITTLSQDYCGWRLTKYHNIFHIRIAKEYYFIKVK